MSPEKAVEYGKEKRKPYHGAKAADGWCKNHGICWICRENRLYKTRIVEEEIKQMKKTGEYLNEEE